MEQQPTDSRWRYLIAAGVIAPIAWIGLLFATYVTMHFDVATLGSVLILVLYVGILLVLLFALAFPVALYQDGHRIRESSFEWQPNVGLYVFSGVVGIFVPLVHQVVGLLYLYNRRRHVDLS